jgi:hypothetical protein
MKPSERKQEILTAAAQLFKAKGYSAEEVRAAREELDSWAGSAAGPRSVTSHFSAPLRSEQTQKPRGVSAVGRCGSVCKRVPKGTQAPKPYPPKRWRALRCAAPTWFGDSVNSGPRKTVRRYGAKIGRAQASTGIPRRSSSS